MRSNLIRPQLSAATAMLQLIRDNPQLPAASWDLLESGSLIAHIYTPDAYDAYRALLGGTQTGPHRFETQGEVRVSRHLRTTWRDIPLTVVGVFEAADFEAHVPATKAVA